MHARRDTRLSRRMCGGGYAPPWSCLVNSGASALGTTWPNNSEGLSPNYGHSPNQSGCRRRGTALAAHPAAQPNLTYLMTFEGNAK